VDGTEVRFTSKPDSLFAILMEAPRGPEVTIESLRAAEGTRIGLLGSDGPLDWVQGSRGITVNVGSVGTDSPAVCLKVTPNPYG